MRNSTFDSIARWSMLLLCALLPFFYIPAAFITIPQSKMILAGVLLLVATASFAYARIMSGTVRIPQSRILAAALLLPVAYAISTAVAGFTTLSLLGSGVEQDTLAGAVLASGTLLAVCAIFSETRENLLPALRGFFIGALVLVGIQWIHLVLPFIPFSGALSGTAGNAFGSWHELGIVFGLFGFLGLSLYNTRVGEGYWRYALIALSALSFLFLLIADFADVWGALGFLALGWCAYEWYRYGTPRNTYEARPYAPWGILFVLALIFVFFGSALTSVLPAPLNVSSFEVRPSWQGTFEIGKESLNKPAALIFGVGPNTFTREWNLYKPAGVNQTQFWNADFNSGVGLVPTSLITTGLLGVLSWILFIGIFFWMFWKAAVRGSRSPSDSLVFAWGAACLYLILFHILYVPGPALNILTFLLIGIFTLLLAGERGLETYAVRLYSGGWKGYVQYGGFILCAIAIVVASLAVLRVNVAEMLVNRSSEVYGNSQDFTRSGALIQDALFVYAGDTRAERAGVELGILELQNLAAAPDASTDAARAQLQSTLEATIQHGLSAVTIDSGDYQNWLELASLYGTLAGADVPGAYDNAHDAYEKALSEDPANPQLFLDLAQLEVLQKNPDAALSDIASAIQLKPDFAAAYYLSSQVYASKNDTADAQTTAANAVKYAPEDPLSWYNQGVIAYASGDWAGAATSEEQALARNPQYANALYVLGLSYYQLGRTADALATFKSLDTLDPGEQGMQQILANLEGGKSPLQAAATATPAR